MAYIPRTSTQEPISIERFLGLNEDATGETQLELGESPYMRNFRITGNYKLTKREGYAELFSALGSQIQGMWYGKIADSYRFLFACNGKVYEHNSGTNTEIGTLTDAKTNFFAHNDKVYMQNGVEYKCWDGTTFGDAEGYVPLVAITTPPAGGGTPFEQINLLTGKKHQQFSPDGTAKTFQLLEKSIASVDKVLENGTEKTTGFTVDLAKGQVTFDTAPVDGTPNSIDIYWTKNNSDREKIAKNRFAMFFGGKNDTRVFIWGNSELGNRYYYSDLANGVPSAEYFPVNNYRVIGSDQYAVTDIVRQYDRQIIFTEKDAWYSFYDPVEDAEGNTIPDFPTSPLNSSKGSIAPNQAQLIDNNPFTIHGGVFEWVSSEVRDERNAKYISKRVQPSLDDVDLASALTFDYEAKSEYWLCVGSVVWIYNYRLDVWYKYDNIPATCFLVIGKDLHFGTVDGRIMRFGDMRTDNGEAIVAKWEMGFYDFGSEWLRKFLNRIWVSINPGTKENLQITWQSDNAGSSEPNTIYYSLLGFDNIDFSNFSFLTSYNPQPFRLKVKAKKFVYFKLLLESSTLVDSVTVLSINLLARVGGETK